MKTEKPTYDELKKKVKELEWIINKKMTDQGERINRKVKIEAPSFIHKSEQDTGVLEKTCQDLLYRLETGIIVHAPDTTILLNNKKATELLGIKEVQLTGKTACELFHGLIDENNLPVPVESLPVNQIARTKAPVKDLLFGLKSAKTNDIIWFSLNGYPILDETGEITVIVISFIDNTEKKKTKDALLESELRYRELVTNSPDAIVIYVDGQIVFVNQACLQVMAATDANELIGKTVLEFVVPEYRPLVIERMKKSGTGRLILPIAEEKFIRLDGIEIDVEVIAMPIIIGNKPAVQLIIRDISQKKLVEKTLQESEEKYRLIFEYSPLGIISFDETGVITACNNNFVKIIGSSAKSLIGLNMMMLPDKKLVTCVQSALNGSPGLYEDMYHSVTANKITPVRAIFTPMYNSIGKVRGGVGIIEDITKRKEAEMAMDESRARFHDLIELAVDGIVTGSHEGFITDANSCFCEMVGRKKEDIIGLHIGESFFTPESLKTTPLNFESLKKGKVVVNERKILRPDGKEITIEMRSKMMPDGSYQSIYRDITQRKNMEEAIKESEKFLIETQTIANLGTYTYDIKADTWTSSEILDLILGIDKSFVRNYNSWIELIYPEMQQSLVEHFTKEVIGQHKQFDREYKIIRKNDNSIRWLHGLGHLKYDDKNRPAFMVGTIRDITQSKEAEEALRQSNKLLNLFMEYSPIYAFIKEVSPNESRVLKASENFRDMIGIAGSQMTGKSMYELFPTDFAAKMTADDWSVVSTGQEIKLEEELNGRFYISIKFPIVSDDKKMLAGYSIDITDNKLFEMEIKQKNKDLIALNAEKDKFFSIIAHDLRSPFNVFLGFTQLMVEDLPKLRPDEIQKIAVMLQNSANNLYSLLENLLEWSRIQRGLTNPEPITLLLNPFIERCMRLIMESANKKEITVDLDIPIELVVSSDVNMLESIIRNLTSNAVKFTPHGGKIKVEARLIPKNKVEISITDTGIGMKKEILEKLFILDENTSRKGTDEEPSTGLGLIICKDFVEKNGGKIWVESEEGKGSIFHFTLIAESMK
ncbi:MAG: PAS domain S-box protein [Bacteroidales bacterium]|nr:PAS domain S-box protein [Bacteroidales bacterium]